MRSISKILVLALLSGGFVYAHGDEPATENPAAEKATSDALELSCVRGNDERVLIIVPKGQGCELHYHKHGKSQVMARSVYSTKICEEVRHNIRENLETSEFRCN